MDRCDTKPILEDIALEGLMSFLEGRNFQLIHIPDECQKLVEEQTEIGWRNFVKGRWSKEWGRLQEEFLESKGLRMERLSF